MGGALLSPEKRFQSAAYGLFMIAGSNAKGFFVAVDKMTDISIAHRKGGLVLWHNSCVAVKGIY